MKKSTTHMFSRFMVLVLLCLALPSYASEESVNAESFQQIASLVRWSGVLFSILIIAATWLLLKFMSSLVETIGSQFAQYRMLLQKLQSFLQFFIYMGAGVVVFVLSFRINDHILALIGGTLAVSVGFALKDLAASFIAGMTVMIDRPFQVGDRVTFEGHYGDIITIGSIQLKLELE